jgi:hypothetical protein
MADKDPSHYFWKNRWSATSAPAAGTTVVAQSPAITPNSKSHLETILYSIWNSNAAQTVQFQVRIASAAGTVIASLDNILAATAVQQVIATACGIPGKRGKQFWTGMNTTVASLTQKVTIAGWTDDSDGN